MGDDMLIIVRDAEEEDLASVKRRRSHASQASLEQLFSEVHAVKRSIQDLKTFLTPVVERMSSIAEPRAIGTPKTQHV